MKKDVLGIKIDDISLEQAVEKVMSWLKKGGKRYIVTPNPEIVAMAQKDRGLKEIINQADLAIPDGVGLKLSGDIVCYTPGIDLMELLIKVSEDYGFTTGYLGGKKGVAEKAAECLQKKYPKLKISFVSDGGEIDSHGIMINDKRNLRSNDLKRLTINDTDILFVGFGPPKQEKWIAKNLDKFPVKVFMGVGGSFDYISGQIPRAPKMIRKMGFEWLFRLIVQPWRIKRQLALFKYIWLVWTADDRE